ncbi:glycosyl transferase family 25 (plasmid) [Rhizobium rosettiformans]|uniref:Glycosyl transferase family 25 n=1 Tax=Rhizobium rosettiformans TaxID=1368430 RepID=A0ABX7F3Z2_9HYPH|nr:glycosyltransferase family 25 protein [Rhizobium rosettiformans]QRF54437.1 glycosyl transferase family 25 [Rhizobium rosettiformans]
MSIRLFAINLDRSTDRWLRLSSRANELGLGVTRVSAVDGKWTAKDEREATDDLAFRRNTGRLMLAGEYGCYRSHIRALHTFLDSGVDVGLIIEDDVELTPDLQDRAMAAFIAMPEADVIKFFNHRVVGFKRSAASALGDQFGRAIHGPLGSSACYGVTRRGAMQLIKHLTIMRYPWDAALERGWDHGARVYTSRDNIATIAQGGTTIATRDIYRSVKFPKWKRLGTYIRRLRDDVVRLQYALRA